MFSSLALVGLLAAIDPPPAPSVAADAAVYRGAQGRKGADFVAELAARLPPPDSPVKVELGIFQSMRTNLERTAHESGVRLLVSEAVAKRAYGLELTLDGPRGFKPEQAWAGLLGIVADGGIGIELIETRHGPMLLLDGDANAALPESGAAPLALPPASADLLPLPSRRVAFDRELGSEAVPSALADLAEASGVRLLVPTEAHKALSHELGSVTLPERLAPEAAWHVLESLLVEAKLVLVVHRLGERPVLSVQPEPLRSDESFRAMAIPIGLEALEWIHAHPALLFEVRLPVANVDPLRTVNSLRSMARTPYLETFLPAEDGRAVVIGGRGRGVGRIVTAVQAADAAAEAR